jgi:hypothetical protein
MKQSVICFNFLSNRRADANITRSYRTWIFEFAIKLREARATGR